MIFVPQWFMMITCSLKVWITWCCFMKDLSKRLVQTLWQISWKTTFWGLWYLWLVSCWTVTLSLGAVSSIKPLFGLWGISLKRPLFFYFIPKDWKFSNCCVFHTLPVFPLAFSIYWKLHRHLTLLLPIQILCWWFITWHIGKWHSSFWPRDSARKICSQNLSKCRKTSLHSTRSE